MFEMDFSWAVDGITDAVPRTTGPECINYMTNRRRWTENIIFTIIFIIIIRSTTKRLRPITLPPQHEIDKPHSPLRLLLLILMAFIFGIEIGFKFAGKSMIFVLNPCHIQTIVQIYLLAAKPNKFTTALFRIQLNNLNGPFLAFVFPEVANRELPFEQATYWIQHGLLYIIPIYILRSGAYTVEDLNDFTWTLIGTINMLLYHFALLSSLSIYTGINLDHMLCAALSDPFQGQNYRIFAVIHELLLCPLLNKGTVFLFSRRRINNEREGYSSFSHRSYNEFSTIDKLPSTFVHTTTAPTTKRLSVGNIGSNENPEPDPAYQQQQWNQLATVPILKHRRRHTTEYHNVPHAEIVAEKASTTLMPTTKID